MHRVRVCKTGGRIFYPWLSNAIFIVSFSSWMLCRPTVDRSCPLMVVYRLFWLCLLFISLPIPADSSDTLDDSFWTEETSVGKTDTKPLCILDAAGRWQRCAVQLHVQLVNHWSTRVCRESAETLLYTSVCSVSYVHLVYVYSTQSSSQHPSEQFERQHNKER